MEISSIKKAILQIYKDCNIKSFPISCSTILNHYGLRVYSYHELKQKNQELYKICKDFSKDAFLYGSLICYNDEMPLVRRRFSLLHELGHYYLHTEDETTANQFASHLLAPRCILQKSGFTQLEDISVLFGISKEAATYALLDVNKHYHTGELALQSNNGLEEESIDHEMLEHFYNRDLQIYIYHISECPICGSNIYNSIKNTCLQCKKLSIKSR